MAFDATLLVALAVADVAADEFYAPLVVLVGFLFVGLPIVARLR